MELSMSRSPAPVCQVGNTLAGTCRRFRPAQVIHIVLPIPSHREQRLRVPREFANRQCLPRMAQPWKRDLSIEPCQSRPRLRVPKHYVECASPTWNVRGAQGTIWERDQHERRVVESLADLDFGGPKCFGACPCGSLSSLGRPEYDERKSVPSPAIRVARCSPSIRCGNSYLRYVCSRTCFPALAVVQHVSGDVTRDGGCVPGRKRVVPRPCPSLWLLDRNSRSAAALAGRPE